MRKLSIGTGSGGVIQFHKQIVEQFTGKELTDEDIARLEAQYPSGYFYHSNSGELGWTMIDQERTRKDGVFAIQRGDFYVVEEWKNYIRINFKFIEEEEYKSLIDGVTPIDS